MGIDKALLFIKQQRVNHAQLTHELNPNRGTQQHPHALFWRELIEGIPVSLLGDDLLEASIHVRARGDELPRHHILKRRFTMPIGFHELIVHMFEYCVNNFLLTANEKCCCRETLRIVGEVPVIGRGDPFAQADGGREAQGVQQRHVEQFARSAVGF